MTDPVTQLPTQSLDFRPPRPKFFAGILRTRRWPTHAKYTGSLSQGTPGGFIVVRTNEVFSTTHMNETRFLTSN